MYNSQYYTCEQIDERLLQGYLDDYNTQTGQSLTKAQFLTKLGSIFSKEGVIDNTATQIGYYECDTAAGTAAKAITVANYALFAGGSMKVKFANKNTANNATLNINSQGAKALYYQGERASATNSWDAEEVVEIYYDGTSYYANNVKGGSGSGVYDVSKEHPTSGPNSDGKFTLEYILNSSNVNELIPVNKRYPGMSIQFVSTYDNKYVQFRYMGTDVTGTPNPFLDTANWQGVDTELVAGSHNLAESGGVYNALISKDDLQCVDGLTELYNTYIDKYIKYENGNLLSPSVPASHNWKAYVISTENVKRIRVKIGSDGNTPAAIAFYTSIGIYPSANYLISSSVRAAAGVNWYVADVPSNAKSIIVSNRGVSLETPTIVLYKSDYLSVDGFEKYKKEVLFSRDESATSRGIYITHDVSNLPLGAQIEIDVTGIGGSTIESVYLRTTDGKADSIFVVSRIGKYYVEKYDGLLSIMFEKGPSEGNVFNYVISMVHDYVIGNRLLPNSYLFTNRNEFTLGTPKRGYYRYATKQWLNDAAWVSYPEQKSNGYKIHVAGDFETYYVQIRLLFTGPIYITEIRVTEESDFNIPTSCYGWNLMFRRNDRADIVPSEVDGDITVTWVNGNMFEKPVVESEIQSRINESPTVANAVQSAQSALSNSNSALKKSGEGYAVNMFANSPQYYHFAANSFIKYNGSNAIASQSLEDVELAARLGFKFIEANIHETSDGKFICIHGTSGAFGPECKSNDENVITTTDLRSTAISSKTLDWIKTYVRYDSYLVKYQTTIPSLEEFCAACKKHGIGIFAGTNVKTAADICIKLMGNNVIFYNPASDIRTYFDGWVFLWANNTELTPTDLLNNARNFGLPFMYGIGPDLIQKYITDNVLEDFIDDMHKEGFLVGWTGTYDTEATGRLVQKLGIDFNCSGHDVNPFEANYEVFDIESDNLPTTTGSISDGIITLAQGETVSCGSTTKIIGKGWLSIRFSGTLIINFGSIGDTNRTITSDGDEDTVISDYFFKKGTTLVITASAATTITNFLYKTSKC